MDFNVFSGKMADWYGSLITGYIAAASAMMVALVTIGAAAGVI